MLSVLLQVHVIIYFFMFIFERQKERRRVEHISCDNRQHVTGDKFHFIYSFNPDHSFKTNFELKIN